MSLRPRHVVEYALLRGTSAVLGRIPYRAALVCGWWLAAVAAVPLRRKITTAQRRIRQVLGPGTPPREVRRIAWISWRNLVFNLVESVRLHRLSRDWVARHVDTAAGLEAIRPVLGEGKGGIIAVPHMGNWELAGLACQLHGIPIIVILGRQRNPLANRYFRQARERLGICVLERHADLMRPVVRQIKAGRFLAILPDSRMPYPDLAIPFLGGTANLGSGMAVFARLTRRPIVPFLPVREGWSRHRIEPLGTVNPIVTDDKTADIRAMTEAVVSRLEAGIRRYPEQWFWYNSRWVLDPVDKQ